MDEWISFLLHLAFVGFFFLSILYVLRVVYFLSPPTSPEGPQMPIIAKLDGSERGTSWAASDALDLFKETGTEASKAN